MAETLVEDLKKAEKVEKKELKYLLREFYELKKLFDAIKDVCAIPESYKKEHPDEYRKGVKTMVEAILNGLRREERIDRRMARIYQRMKEEVEKVEAELAQSYPGEVEKLKKLIKQAEVFNEDLIRLGSRTGLIEQKLKEAEKEPKKIEEAFSVIDRSMSDVKGFEEVVYKLVHIDLFLLKQGERLGDSEISAELRKMEAADQGIRSGLELEGIHSGAKTFNDVDAYNISRLKKILEHHQVTNPKDIHIVWLLVQHADFDPAFQEKMLKTLPFSPKDKAYLTDRIRTNTGRPQVYGTQFQEPAEGIIALCTVEGAKVESEFEYSGFKCGPLTKESLRMLDERRSAMGITTSISRYYEGNYFIVAGKWYAGGIFRYLYNKSKRPKGILMWLDPKVGKIH